MVFVRRCVDADHTFSDPGGPTEGIGYKFQNQKSAVDHNHQMVRYPQSVATNKRQSIGSKSIVTHALRLSKVASLATSLLTISN